LTTATATAISFGASDTEVFDTSSFHSPTSDNSRITIPTGLGGKYAVVAGIQYATNATGMRYCSIYKNGAIEAVQRTPANSVSLAGTLLTASTIISLSAGDYVELYGFQNSGGNLNVNTGTSTFLAVQFLGV
jgi:hypothetical protein